jgi:hypothetical protein
MLQHKEICGLYNIASEYHLKYTCLNTINGTGNMVLVLFYIALSSDV